jgi:hypothetical protein
MNKTTVDVQEPAFITNINTNNKTDLPNMTFSQLVASNGETEDEAFFDD